MLETEKAAANAMLGLVGVALSGFFTLTVALLKRSYGRVRSMHGKLQIHPDLIATGPSNIAPTMLVQE